MRTLRSLVAPLVVLASVSAAQAPRASTGFAVDLSMAGGHGNAGGDYSHSGVIGIGATLQLDSTFITVRYLNGQFAQGNSVCCPSARLFMGA